MKVNITSSGNFSNLERWATKMSTEDFTSVLKSAAQPGKSEFMRKTPVESGKSANAWDYKIEKTSTGASLEYSNSNVTKNGVPVVTLINYGHGTGTGGYVRPIPFIQNVVKSIEEQISKDVEKRMISNG